MAMQLASLKINSPTGTLRLVANNEGLCAIEWQHSDDNSEAHDPQSAESRHAILSRAAAQLAEYFEGKREQFDLPLAACGTEFQKKVWAELALIPYGQTTTYGAMARAVGSPKGARAVGAANRRNPLPIVVPCHRAIGTSGALIGFAGGLPAKIALLAIEAKRE